MRSAYILQLASVGVLGGLATRMRIFMIKMITKNFSQQEWQEIVSQFEDLSMIQLWEYGETKTRLQGWRAVRQVFYCDNIIVGAVQVMIKMIPGFNKGVVWMNRGPLWKKKGETPNLERLQEILNQLVGYWAKKEKMYLRIAPTLEDNVESQSLLLKQGLTARLDTQWISIRVDLAQSPETLRSNLEKKWRNCLARAEKLGVSFEIGNGEDFLKEFTADYTSFLKEKKFSTPITPEFVVMFQQLLPAGRKMWVLTACLNEVKLGSILIAIYGNSAEYLVGAVNEQGKQANAGQFLLWSALYAMKNKGVQWFDLGGADPQKTPKGIMHFKQGLNGKPYQLVGEYDLAQGWIARLIKIIISPR